MIGKKFEESKFVVNTNPFGIIYNPISQSNLFDLNDSILGEHNFYARDGVVYNYHFHSELFAESVPEYKANVLNLALDFDKTITSADLLIFTFGTAFIYRLLSSDQIVANCHKASSSLFKRDTLQEEMIVSSFKTLIAKLRYKNPSLKFIITVSPVRHIKDTIVLNSLSKAILRVACHRICEDLNDVSYFPSFELMMDDLRDYRFYKEDMIHPTEVAEDYIWSKFSESFFSKETREIMKEWHKVRKAIEHDPFQPQSDGYRTFIKQAIDQTKKLERYFNVETELNILQNKLFLNQ